MTQDERWAAKYNEVIFFIDTNHRNPSKHDEEERGKYLRKEQGDGYLFHRKTKSVIINS